MGFFFLLYYAAYFSDNRDVEGIKRCVPLDDKTTLMITIFLCFGIVVSYLPQHYRIIANKTSEGFSAWFLLLGVISSSSSLLNIIVLQWDAIVCCKSLVSPLVYHSRLLYLYVFYI
ncbi:unnamed protein product [Rhizopus microsporus]